MLDGRFRMAWWSLVDIQYTIAHSWRISTTYDPAFEREEHIHS